MKPDTLTLASEKGGIGKTTTTVGLARELAERGLRVGVVDLDPRATATTWLAVELRHALEHVGAILGQDDVEGAAADLALVSPWHPNIAVVPSARDVAALESSPPEYGDVRLRRALAGWDRDVVLIDTPNRQGGYLIRSALAASDRVLYAAMADEDGRSGVEWARLNVAKFKQLSPLNPSLAEAGIVITRWPAEVPTRDAKTALAALEAENEGLVLKPLIPARTVVPSSRTGEVWFGAYSRGRDVAEAFSDLTDLIWPQYAKQETR